MNYCYLSIMSRKLILIVLTTWLCSVTAISIDMMRQAKKDVGIPFPFDYMYRNLAPRRYSSSYYYERSRPTTTTERPIVRYWNNLMRNVRLPIPTITWNMTNPLVNLFNAGETNVMETPVANYHTSAGGGGAKRKRKNTRKHTNSNPTHKRSKNRKRKNNYEQQEEAAEQEEQLALQPYPNDFDPNKAMFFYDPGTHQYYEVQRLNAQNDNNENDDLNEDLNSKDPYNDDVDIADVSQTEEGTTAESQEEEHQQDLEASDLINAANEMSADDIERMRLDMLNSKHHDDDITVVTKLDDDDEKEETPQAVNDMKITTSKNDEEMLRNVLGSYMSDDDLNRKRQRAGGKRNRVKSVGRPKPRDPYRFYVLQAW